MKLALARQYRPRTFQEMVGQETVLQALGNALQQKRLHHAYLFTGTRGVGKTTLARIIAKCLNCEVGISALPCGKCVACQEIDQGRFIDLIEVDAASRTKVEDTRELLENVQYLPSRGRYKIYLIDEVHMLSNHSFNALLKTLEEPPSHVIFLLATTDPQKLPATVLSRCLQFHLWRVPVKQIIEHLKNILQKENASFEEEALMILARAADGSLRDALSLLDQAISFSHHAITASAIRTMLGVSEKETLVALLTSINQGNAYALLRHLQQLEEKTPDFSSLLAEFLELLYQVTLTQAMPEALDESLPDREKIIQLAKEIASEEIQLYYQIGLQGQRDLPFSPTPKMGFEMTLLRMIAFQPVRIASISTERVEKIEKQEKEIIPEVKIPQENQENTVKNTVTFNEWEKMVRELSLTGLAKVLAEHCVVKASGLDFVELILDETQKPLYHKRYEERLQEAVSQYLGRTIRLKIVESAETTTTPAAQKHHRVAEAVESTRQMVEVDAKLQKLMKAFDAKIEQVTLKDSE
jgi:DNA polymerase-3 subunit gamma/tau